MKRDEKGNKEKKGKERIFWKKKKKKKEEKRRKKRKLKQEKKRIHLPDPSRKHFQDKRGSTKEQKR